MRARKFVAQKRRARSDATYQVGRNEREWECSSASGCAGRAQRAICCAGGFGAGMRRIDFALSGETERGVDVVACGAGAVRIHSEGSDGMDRDEAGTAADQYLRVGDVLPDV